MTDLPAKESATKLGLVIDLDTCVGCHACVVSCKEWNTGGHAAPLSDNAPYGVGQSGAWLNRVHSYEVEATGGNEPGRTIYFPKSCLHCADAPCVTVCPTGASYKRADDGIVLVDEDKCIGCGLCAWACAYGAREMDPADGVMKKCTLCVDRIYNDHIPEAERVPACVATCPSSARHFGDLGDPDSAVSKLVEARGGYDLMPEQGCRPTNKYLPPRAKQPSAQAAAPALAEAAPEGGFWAWLDKALSD